jgi:hypothetical protein
MKKFLCVFVLFCCGFMLYAQDIITLKNGEEIEAVVQEVGVDSVKYKKPDTEVPIYTLLKSEIFMIKYANGDKETFKVEAAQDPRNTVTIAPPDNFTTGQRWGAWALNQFTIPGLGSYVIMKDWVGGSVMLGLGLAGYIFTIAGATNMVNSTMVTYDYYDGYKETTDSKKIVKGVVMVGIGSLVFLGDFIYTIVRCSTYDKPAPKVTKGFDPARLNVALLPGTNGGNAVQVSYTMRF